MQAKHGLKETSSGIILPVKVTPKSHRNEILGWENQELKIKIAATPEKGNANDVLLRFLAEYLKISFSSITLIAGATSRHKRICIMSLSFNEVVQALNKEKKT